MRAARRHLPGEIELDIPENRRAASAVRRPSAMCGSPRRTPGRSPDRRDCVVRRWRRSPSSRRRRWASRARRGHARRTSPVCRSRRRRPPGVVGTGACWRTCGVRGRRGEAARAQEKTSAAAMDAIVGVFCRPSSTTPAASLAAPTPVTSDGAPRRRLAAAPPRRRPRT